MADTSSFPDDTSPTFSVSAQGEALIVQLVANLIISFVAFLSFCILRRTWRVVFSPRTAIASRNSPQELPTRNCFSWIAPLWRINDDEILRHSGLDALTYLRFLKMCLHIAIQMCILGLLILLPANFVLSTKQYSNGRTFWDFLDINSIPSGSGYLFVHAIFTWAFSILTICHLHKFYAAFISAREFYMTSAGLKFENGISPHTTDRNRNIHARTIIVSGIPPELCDEEALSSWFTGLGVGRVQKAHLVRHHAPLDLAITTRTDALLSLERLCTQLVEKGRSLHVSKQPRSKKRGHMWKRWMNPSHRKSKKSSATNSNFIPLRSAHKEPEEIYDESENFNSTALSLSDPSLAQHRPKMRVGAFGLYGPETDAISYQTAELHKWDAAVVKLRKEVKEKSDRLSGQDTKGRTAFVTFYSQRSANVLAQTLNHSKIFTCVTRMAPEPHDIFWQNISIHPMNKRVRLVAVQTLLVFMACFWAIPTSVVSTLLSVEKLSSTFPFVRSIISNSVILERFFEGLVPTWIISILISWLPCFLRYFTQVQGTTSLSGIEEDVFSRYFLFSFINVILVMSIGGTVWHASLDTILESHNILSLLGSSLPKVAAFFNNYVILQALLVVPVFDLLRLGSWFQIWRKLRFARSPREKADALLPPYLRLGEIYVGPTIIVIVGLLYSVIAPVILLLCVCYFSVTFFVHKYQLLYVYRPMYETGGRIWPMVFRRLIAGLLLFQSTMCGLLVLKDEPVAATLCLPAILVTVLFDRYCTAAYKSRAYFHSLDISPHEVHEVEEDAFVNPVFGFFDRRTPTLAENESLNDVVLSGKVGQRAQPEMRHNYYGVLEPEVDPTGNYYPYWEPAVGGKLPELWIENHQLEQEVLGHATRRPAGGALTAEPDADSWNSLNV